jgi:hypothetical protein
LGINSSCFLFFLNKQYFLHFSKSSKFKVTKTEQRVMKLAIISLLIALSLIQTACAQWYGGYGGYGYGYGYPWYASYVLYGKRVTEETPGVQSEKTECFYLKETSMLTCMGKSEKQECEALSKMDETMKFEFFGIVQYKDETTGDKKFALLPRALDNTAWLDDFVTVNDKKTYFSIYQSSKLSDYGFQVKSSECFDKIFELLKKSTRHEKVYIQSKTEVTPEAILIGKQN